MAAIDKTYVNNWKDLKAIQDWAKTAYAVDGLGNKYNVYEWCNDMTENEFNESIKYQYDRWKAQGLKLEEYDGCAEVVVWNTPTWLDVWLIKNCPLEVIQNRLKQQYGNSYEDIKNGTSIYDTYKRNGLGKNIRFKVLKKPNFHARIKCSWWVQCNDDYWYNDELDVWSRNYELIPYTTNVAHIHGHLTERKILRYLKKWNLPKGIHFRISGAYVGQDWLIVTT